MYHGERFNSISHLIGAITGLVGLIVLITYAVRDGDPWKIASFSIYGATLTILYAVSTAYHSSRGRKKEILQILDYHSIYLLIAGTYTPFTLVSLRGGWGWTLFIIIWVLAVIGVLYDTIFRGGKRIFPLLIYLVMGWLIVIAIKPLLSAVTPAGVWCLFIGGVFYSVGVVFFVNGDRIRHFHGIWHLFVLAGSVMHYFTIYFYVL